MKIALQKTRESLSSEFKKAHKRMEDAEVSPSKRHAHSFYGKFWKNPKTHTERSLARSKRSMKLKRPVRSHAVASRLSQTTFTEHAR